MEKKDGYCCLLVNAISEHNMERFQHVTFDNEVHFVPDPLAY